MLCQCYQLIPTQCECSKNNPPNRSETLHNDMTHSLKEFYSLTVVEEMQVPQLGKFTAFKDGKVRTVFDDRTIMTMDYNKGTCEVINKDGSVQFITTSNPGEYQHYARFSVEFAQWAFASPAQRSETQFRNKQREFLLQVISANLEEAKRFIDIRKMWLETPRKESDSKQDNSEMTVPSQLEELQRLNECRITELAKFIGDTCK